VSANQKVIPTALEAFLKGEIDWSSDTFKAVLVNDTYTFSAGDEFLDDIASGERSGISDTITGKTTTDGYAGCDALQFSTPDTAETVTGLWVYKHTGTESTSRLIAFFDAKASGAAISVLTTGAPLIVQVTGPLFRI